MQGTRHPPTVIRRHDRMQSDIRPVHDALCGHWVYQQMNDMESLRTFMTSHVFAVWDFMTLIKTLQRRLTCTDTPWFPPRDPDSARLVNEIVLCEETDEVQAGLYMSHFELYLAAMQEVGADRGPIDQLLDRLYQGIPVHQAVEGLLVPKPTQEFVTQTLRLCETAETHQVAAAFLYGREHVIPDMFKALLTQPVVGGTLSAPVGEHLRRWLRRARRAIGPRGLGWTHSTVGPGPNALRLYLERHIELDGDSHGPMGVQLLMNLCGKDRQKWEEATEAAENALLARHRMWDGVAKAIVTSHADGWQPQHDTPVISLAWRRNKKTGTR